MNRPVVKDCIRVLLASLRKLGDSNPRYGNPHGSLANCWFQPLTQTSLPVGSELTRALFLKCGCKGTIIFCYHQMFSAFFFEFVVISFLFPLVARFLFHLVAQSAPLATIARVVCPFDGSIDAVGCIAHAKEQYDGDYDFLHK